MSHFYNFKIPPLGKKERIILILLCASLIIWLYNSFLLRPIDYDSLLDAIEQHHDSNGESFSETVSGPGGIGKYTYVKLGRAFTASIKEKYQTYLLKNCLGELYSENQQQLFPYPEGSICDWYRIKDSKDDILLIRKDANGQLSLWRKDAYLLSSILNSK